MGYVGEQMGSDTILLHEKTQKTSKADIDLAAARYKLIAGKP